VAEHPNAARIRDGYAAFAKGDFAVLNDLLAEDLVWHHGGRSQLAGDYRGRDAVYELLGKLIEVTHGTFHMDLEAAFANDELGVALVVASSSVDGRSVAAREAHIMRMSDSKVVEFWYTSTDQYAFDEMIG
jgi:ketosteroid isomerase-like protein